MTVIVYRDGVMCSDSQVSVGDVFDSFAKKIFKNKKGHLLGAAGNAGDLMKIKTWFEGPPDSLPIDNLSNALDGILVQKDKIWLLDQFGMTEVYGPYFVAGSGRQVALGALRQGATAREAVEVAIYHCNGVGGEIQELILG